MERLQQLLAALFLERSGLLVDPTSQFVPTSSEETTVSQSLNAAFLLLLTGKHHPCFGKALRYLRRKREETEWEQVAGFYLGAYEAIVEEMAELSSKSPDFSGQLENLAEWARCRGREEEAGEQLWSFFFPEGVGIFDSWEERIEKLRSERTVHSLKLNARPIRDPATEILFTSNALLTPPLDSRSGQIEDLGESLNRKLSEIREEEQAFWYDHPIPIGVRPENNEILYGLRGLQEAFRFERRRGNSSVMQKLKCLLSVSVTHRGLHDIASEYLQELFRSSELLEDLEIFVFTEIESGRIIKEVLEPATCEYLDQSEHLEALREVFGVDGEYGRHYTFLKAITALWHVLLNREIRATFKIDLDQVFPQEELVKETGLTAFEHLMTRLWGSSGLDCRGRPIELGMIAGALVNKQDINDSLFTPDVKVPSRHLNFDEYIFFSLLPQALSTEAEMMTRYTGGDIDGKSSCLQRVHVTGGTNGILVESLRKHRPYTPTFVGRAEDQAYILSTFNSGSELLGYAHKDGLIMRHDKKFFAQEAMEQAKVGKLIGDYERILKFSAYARTISDDLRPIKERLDPFTGCFVTPIPVTLCCLRFGLRASRLFSEGEEEMGQEFVRVGTKRLGRSLQFVKEGLKEVLERERAAWDLYYDVLAALEKALESGEDFAIKMADRTKEIVNSARLRK